MIMTVNFYLDRTSKKEERTIFAIIRGTIGKREIAYHTGEKITLKEWDSTKQKAKSKYIGAPQLNQKLSLLKEKLLLTYRNIEIEALTDKNYIITPELIRSEFDKVFNKNTSKTLTFFEALDLFIEVRKDMTPASLQKFRALKRHLEDFETTTKYKVNFSTIDLMFFDMFKDFLLTIKKHTNNTVSKQFGLFKMFLNWTTKRNLSHNLTFKQFSFRETPTEVIYLTNDELFRLLNFNLKDNSKLSEVRDTFCFACFTGARFSDVSKLEWNDIDKNNNWNLRTIKTKDLLTIPLNSYAVSILEKHKGQSRPLKVISNQKMNEYLKDLCEKAEIKDEVKRVRYSGNERKEEKFLKYELIGTHTARRTFITLSLEKGMRPETVMEITGHKDYKMMKKYIKISSKVKETEMRAAWTSPKLRIVKGKK
jgi:integrase